MELSKGKGLGYGVKVSDKNVKLIFGLVFKTKWSKGFG